MRTNFNRTAALCVLLAALAVPLAASAQSGQDGFDPNVDGPVHVILELSDGGLLIAGEFDSVGGDPRPRLARLHRDGHLDADFAPVLNGPVTSLAETADGGLLVGGEFTEVNGDPRAYLARLDASGSLDGGFDPGALDGAVDAIAPAAGGKILIGGRFSAVAGNARAGLARLNTDGTLDAAFEPQPDGAVTALLHENEHIYLAGDFGTVAGSARDGLARLQTDGELDTNFQPPAGGWGLQGMVNALVLQPDGSLVVGGEFTGVAGEARQYLARVTHDGLLDTAYQPTLNAAVNALALQPDGRLLLGGNFTTVEGEPRAYLARLHMDGALDSDFDVAADGPLYAVVSQRDRKPLFGGDFTEVDGHPRNSIARLNRDATVEVDFIAGASDFNPTQGVTAAFQPDGKLLIGGDFTHAGVHAVQSIARLRQDGTVDTDFQPPSNLVSPSTRIKSIAVLDNGKIMVGGDIHMEDGEQGRRAIWRLNPDGSLDQGFQKLDILESRPQLEGILVQPDGKLVLSGADFTIDGIQHVGVARLNADGTLDSGFTAPTETPPLEDVRSTALQRDGAIVFGGNFDAVNGVARTDLARLGVDGALDMSFQPQISFGPVNNVHVEPRTGAILAAGIIDAAPGGMVGITLFHADGSRDESFLSPGFNSVVTGLSVQSNGAIMVGGTFTEVGGSPQPYLARLLSDGTHDSSFAPELDGGMHPYGGITIDIDGKPYVQGSFPDIRLSTREMATESLSVSDTAEVVRWRTGGSMPVMRHVQLSWSDDRSQWHLLGSAAAETMNEWRLDVDPEVMPREQNFWLRVRARTPGGFRMGSESLHEFVHQVYLAGPEEFVVTPTASEGGQLDPADPQTVVYGETVMFQVLPNAGYRTDTVEGCGGSLSGELYETAAVTEDCTVNAAFVELIDDIFADSFEVQ